METRIKGKIKSSLCSHSTRGFVENIKKLPVNEHSVIIRAVKGYLGRHPAWVPGSRMITLLEKIPVFLDDYQAGLYPDYWSLVSTHYISGGNHHTDSASEPKAIQLQP